MMHMWLVMAAMLWPITLMPFMLPIMVSHGLPEGSVVVTDIPGMSFIGASCCSEWLGRAANRAMAKNDANRRKMVEKGEMVQKSFNRVVTARMVGSFGSFIASIVSATGEGSHAL